MCAAVNLNVGVEIIIGNRKVACQARLLGFSKKFFLQFLIAERGAVLIGEAFGFKGAVGYCKREFTRFSGSRNDTIRVFPPAGLQLESGVLNDRGHCRKFLKNGGSRWCRSRPGV